MTDTQVPSAAIRMLSAAEMKSRAAYATQAMLGGPMRGGVVLDLSKLSAAADLAEDLLSKGFPDLQLPPHGCWRSFELDGFDRWGMLAAAREFASPEEMLCCAGDLAVLAAVLDVAMPQGWCFEERLTGKTYSGASGRAIAALTMFAAGSFSAGPEDPLRLDAHALIRLETHEIAAGLQLDPEKDSDLIERITHHLRRLGETIGLRPDLFERNGSTRPGHLLEQLWREAAAGSVGASTCLEKLLDGISPLWQGGASLDEVILGDCWHHPDILQESEAPGLVPFHLPALQIAYSFVEPLAWAGVLVTGLEDLPGLSDLENVAFFQEMGVIAAGREDPADAQKALCQMIELRAATVVLLDKLAGILRERFEASADELPLTCVLAAATGPAARKFAVENPGQWEKAAKSLAAGGVFWLPFGA